ncbi:MAG: hypothetical protein ACOYEV_13925 [Candidatus Nanopelagicales bacterium]
MRPLRLEHEGVFSASLRVDGRVVECRPMRGSGMGEVSGLAVVACTERDVLDAAAWLPGRVLVLTGRSITRNTVPVVVKGAHMATFAGLVVIADDLHDLGHMGESGLPVPVVFVQREADHAWMRKAMRVSVSVLERSEVLDVRGDRPERRRRPAISVVNSVPGIVNL